MSISLMSAISEHGERRRRRPLEDDDCPDYEAAVSASTRSTSPSNGTGSSIQYSSPFVDDNRTPSRLVPVTPLNTTTRGHRRPLPRHERYVYTYRLLANSTPVQFMISVEPESGRPQPGKCTFRLSFKANGIERPLCEPTSRKLKVDPRHLDFVVFIFPGKSSAPTGCLWSLRVWLRVNNIDHRIFGEDDLWVGKDPDFHSIADASFARQKSGDSREQVYNAYVGKALVTFFVRWEPLGNNLYKYSVEYDASGVGDMLFEDLRLRLDGNPQAISFLIFSTPSNSIPAGASHKLRIWLRSVAPLPPSNNPGYTQLPFNDSYVYQRIWTDDAFKIGARLDFESLGAKMHMGFPSAGGPETIVMPSASASMDMLSPARSLFKDKKTGYGDF